MKLRTELDEKPKSALNRAGHFNHSSMKPLKFIAEMVEFIIGMILFSIGVIIFAKVMRALGVSFDD